jgi:hypothetical protein
MFFPGQKPVPDGHGVHSFPPPPRMYVPSWQGRHWPARRVVLVERLGSACHDRPGLCPFVNESQAHSARTLFFDEAEAGAVAAEELQIRTIAPVASNNFASTGPVAATIVLERETASYQSACTNTSTRKLEQTKEPNCMDQSHRQHRKLPTKSLKRAATHLARYRDCARVARRYDRLH